ncbi:MAG: carbon starvation protein A [Phycisphaeraceae bacterium]|nr:carbon starvation protein A [Phycisphaeraceae bacterium]
MGTLLIAVASGIGFLVAYHTYGRWLSRKIFRLDAKALVPSVEVNDDRDYVPTAKSIVFGHHFASIAGTGPIVGPAIAIMWGWLPALLWVVFGSILIGAVHDLGSLVISLRNKGQTVGDIAGRVLNPRVRILFLIILLFALWIVLAIFGLVIANVFTLFPASVLPVWLQIPIAVWIGVMVHRRGKKLFWPSVLALGLMYLTVWFGAECPGLAWDGGWLGHQIHAINTTLSAWPIWVWTAVLLVYCYVASVLPVWVLLQPRDYINSLQLLTSLGLIVAGLIVAALMGSHGQPLELAAPAVQLHPLNAPSILPFLFITVACGAVSGFHCLVSSGTSSKQLKCETDAHFVGYGAMLTEGFLAVLVILAVGAGIGFGWPGNVNFQGLAGGELWNAIYHDWNAAEKGLGVKIGAFVVGAANLIESLGINHTMATALMGVFVASFADTTLDTATRLQRYVVEELAGSIQASAPMLRPLTQPLRNPHGATTFAVVTAFALALMPMPGQPWSLGLGGPEDVATAGKGGMLLWPLFGATNQLLAGLSFIVVCFWLWRRGIKLWFAAVPGAIMLVMPAWAMITDCQRWAGKEDWSSRLLLGVAVLVLVLEAWMIVEALLLFPKIRGVLEEPAKLPAKMVKAGQT